MLKISMPQLTYPSSHNHGSVKNGSLQIVYSYLSTANIFHFHDCGRKSKSTQHMTNCGGSFKYLGIFTPVFFWGNHDPIWRIAIFFKGVGEKTTPPFGSKKVMFPTGFQHPTVGDSYLMVPPLTHWSKKLTFLKMFLGNLGSTTNCWKTAKNPWTMKKQKGYHNRIQPQKALTWNNLQVGLELFFFFNSKKLLQKMRGNNLDLPPLTDAIVANIEVWDFPRNTGSCHRGGDELASWVGEGG